MKSGRAGTIRRCSMIGLFGIALDGVPIEIRAVAVIPERKGG